MPLNEQQKGHVGRKKISQYQFCFKTSMYKAYYHGSKYKRAGCSLKYLVATKRLAYRVTNEDMHDKDDWGRRIKGAQTHPCERVNYYSINTAAKVP